MIKKTISVSKMFLIIIFILFVSTVHPVNSQETPQFKKLPIMLKASKILPQKLLRGDNYVVDETVINDGFVNTYTLSTNYGQSTVESTAGLMIRIQELRALAYMEQIARSDIFAGSAKDAVTGPFVGTKDLVTSPIESSKEMGRSFVRHYSNIGRSIVSRDPHQDNVLKTFVGYDGAKRAFAYEFKVNSYSDYEPVTNRLGQIARSATAGGFAVSQILDAATGSISSLLAMSISSDESLKIVRDSSPGALAKRNKKLLKEMRIEESLIKSYINNYIYDPQEKTLLVGELATLHGVEGQDIFIAIATLATSKSVALYWRTTAQMMAGYHANIAKAVSIVNIAGNPSIKRGDGHIVLIAPLDYIFWTTELETELNAIDNAIKASNAKGKELWISGNINNSARKVMVSRGWKITENAKNKLIK